MANPQWESFLESLAKACDDLSEKVLAVENTLAAEQKTAETLRTELNVLKARIGDRDHIRQFKTLRDAGLIPLGRQKKVRPLPIEHFGK